MFPRRWSTFGAKCETHRVRFQQDQEGCRKQDIPSVLLTNFVFLALCQFVICRRVCFFLLLFAFIAGCWLCLPFRTMPRQIFSDDLEARLIELWADYQKSKSGQMVKRIVREREIAEKLNAFAKESNLDIEITPLIVNNKVDNLKAKARDLYESDSYRRFRRSTATGSQADKTDIDLEAAYLMWGNFKRWNHHFREVPGLGPLHSLDTCVVSAPAPPPNTSGVPASPRGHLNPGTPPASTQVQPTTPTMSSLSSLDPAQPVNTNPANARTSSSVSGRSSCARSVSRPPMRMEGDEYDFLADSAPVTPVLDDVPVSRVSPTPAVDEVEIII
eukprot:scpid26375/ scgid4370/ 